MPFQSFQFAHHCGVGHRLICGVQFGLDSQFGLSLDLFGLNLLKLFRAPLDGLFKVSQMIAVHQDLFAAVQCDGYFAIFSKFEIDNRTSVESPVKNSLVIETENGKVAITLHGGEEILMNGDHLADLEETIKRRTKELQEIQAEEIKRQAELRIQSELNAANQAMANAAMMGKLKGLKRNS